MLEGLSLHAKVALGADDHAGRERLARYLARPPIASERLSLAQDGRVVYGLRRHWKDGTRAVGGTVNAPGLGGSLVPADGVGAVGLDIKGRGTLDSGGLGGPIGSPGGSMKASRSRSKPLFPLNSQLGVCGADTIENQAGSPLCLYASTTPGVENRLYPLTENLFVRANGNVGMGTTMPGQRLHVNNGAILVTGGNSMGGPMIVLGGGSASDINGQWGMEYEPTAQGLNFWRPWPAPNSGEQPGKLRTSFLAYDKRVAGVVSGGGEIRPGIALSQPGTLDGELAVALVGRVYVKASAENGSIAPGDLLTTSATPGHAMKVLDQARCQGAVLGKAMTSLEEGTGLVLVLVNLQ